jgi:uncharacterized protein YjiS (DUF1127 family)
MEAAMNEEDRRGPRWSRLKYHLSIWRREARLHHELMNLDDRILRDIGLQRGETKPQGAKLFWRE